MACCCRGSISISGWPSFTWSPERIRIFVSNPLTRGTRVAERRDLMVATYSLLWATGANVTAAVCTGNPCIPAAAGGNAGITGADCGSDIGARCPKQRVCGHHQVASFGHPGATCKRIADEDSYPLWRPCKRRPAADGNRPPAAASHGGFAARHGTPEKGALR